MRRGPETGLGAPRPTDAVARKVVTIVFADLIGSTALHERLDPESVSRLMDRYYQVVREPVEAHGGRVVQLLGDGVMCAFGIPRAGEDDAIRAVRAAVGIQRAFRAFAGEQSELVGNVGLRVAVNTGEVVVSDEHAAGLGDLINVAARLQQEGHDGDVLVSESTQRLVSALVTLTPLGVLSLKGRSETVAAYRVVSLDRPAGAPATAFVGREDELRRIMAVYDAAVAARRARLAVILGSPGLGKSRLVDELARRLGERAIMVTARCDAAGGATFAPLAEALRAVLHLDAGASGDALRAAIEAMVPGEESERTRIAGGITALLAGTPASPEETFFVVRRLLAALAGGSGVVIQMDSLTLEGPRLPPGDRSCDNIEGSIATLEVVGGPLVLNVGRLSIGNCAAIPYGGADLLINVPGRGRKIRIGIEAKGYDGLAVLAPERQIVVEGADTDTPTFLTRAWAKTVVLKGYTSMLDDGIVCAP